MRSNRTPAIYFFDILEAIGLLRTYCFNLLGNVIRHAYDAIALDTIWNILQNELPPLKAALESTMLEHFPNIPLP